MKIIIPFCFFLLYSSVTQAGLPRYPSSNDHVPSNTPSSINITTLYAAIPTTSAVEQKELKHGVFSWALIETLTTTNETSPKLDMASIISRVAKKVADKTKNAQKVQSVNEGGQLDSPICSEQTTYLLSIGIKQYPVLPHNGTLYSINDVEGIAKALKQRCRTLEQTVLIDAEATKANIKQQLNKIIEKAKAKDHIIINFSGNGVHMDGQSYLLPYDVKISETNKKKMVVASALDIKVLNKYLKRSQASHGIMLLDACF